MSLFGQSDKDITNRTTKTTASVDIPENFQALMDSIIGQSMSAAGSPYEGERIAGLGPDELAAFERIRGLPGAGGVTDLSGEGLGAALQGLQGLSRAPTSGDIQPFMDPYMDLVLSDAQERLNESLETGLTSLSRRGALASGTSGRAGIRGDISRNLAVEDYLKSSRELQYRGLSQAFNQALGLYEGRQRDLLSGGLQARGQDIAAARGLQGMDLQAIQALLGAGGLERGLRQAQADFDYTEPFQRASFLSGIAAAFPTDLFTRRATEKMHQEKYTQQNPINTALGLASTVGNIAFPGMGGGIGGLAQGIGGMFGGSGGTAGGGGSTGKGFSSGGLVKSPSRYFAGGPILAEALPMIIAQLGTKGDGGKGGSIEDFFNMFSQGEQTEEKEEQREPKSTLPVDTLAGLLGGSRGGLVRAYQDGGVVTPEEKRRKAPFRQFYGDFLSNLVERARPEEYGGLFHAGISQVLGLPKASTMRRGLGKFIERNIGLDLPGISDVEAFPELFATPADPEEVQRVIQGMIKDVRAKKKSKGAKGIADADPSDMAREAAETAKEVQRKKPTEQHILDRLLGELEEQSKERGSPAQRNASFSRALGEELASGRAPATNLARSTTAYLPEKAPSKREVMEQAIEATKAKAYETQANQALAAAQGKTSAKMREMMMEMGLERQKAFFDTAKAILTAKIEAMGPNQVEDPEQLALDTLETLGPFFDPNYKQGEVKERPTVDMRQMEIR